MPLQALKIFFKAKTSSSKEASSSSTTGSLKLDNFLKSLPPIHLKTLLLYLKSYATSPKHTTTVHEILALLLRSYPASVFVGLGSEVKETLEALRVYAVRHEERVCLLARDLGLVDYVLDRMNVLI